MARSLETANHSSNNNNNSRAGSAESNRNDAISEISRLLLEGWTLLGEVCPVLNCNTPLVRNKNTGVKLCCSCRAQVVQSTNHIATNSNSSNDNDNSNNNNSMNEQDGGEPSPFSSLNIEPEQSSSMVEIDYIREFQRDSDRVSKQIGEKLLQGWTLLDVNCPNSRCACPLMRDTEGSLFCVSCQQSYEETAQREMHVDDRSTGEAVECLENKRPRTLSCGEGTTSSAAGQDNGGNSILRATEATLLQKIDKLQASLSQSEDMQECLRISEQLSSFLSNLQKVRSCLVHSSAQLSS